MSLNNSLSVDFFHKFFSFAASREQIYVSIFVSGIRRLFKTSVRIT